MGYRLHVLGLRCVAAQEIDGDEIYLVVAERTIWSAGATTMSERPASTDQIDALNFVEGTKHTLNGWEPLPNFEADAFIVAANEPILIRLYERDLLLGDDLLGEAVVSEKDAAGGQIQLAFTGEAAHYMLTIRVEPVA